jgi:Low psii accumulation1 / Rep27
MIQSKSKLWIVILFCIVHGSSSFSTPRPVLRSGRDQTMSTANLNKISLFSSNKKNNSRDSEALLQTKFGGFTVKQRLREEIESPFRTIRLVFFGSSAVSALLALYFSATSTIRALYFPSTISDISLDQSLQNCAINLGAVLLCSALTYREYLVGQANLERIAKGGALARLAIVPPSTTQSLQQTVTGKATVGDYRRAARILIAVGGSEYIEALAQSLADDALSEALERVEVLVIPVVLMDPPNRVGTAQKSWEIKIPLSEDDRAANRIVAFPQGNAAWYDYLESEIQTATKQGFDVLQKGFTIFVKKNGRILRRATGQPQWSGIIETMDVMDGSKFGMPGDTEKYGS